MANRIQPRSLPLWLALILMLAIAAPTLAQESTGELRSYADVAEKTMPAVVNISTDKLVTGGGRNPLLSDPMLRRFFNQPDPGEDDTESEGRMEHSLGSGIVISADGYILTNNHVVENDQSSRHLCR